MSSNGKRKDSYRSFGFRVAFAAAAMGVAAFIVAKRQVRRDPEAVRRNAYWRMFG
jgi:hypothetical protein